MGFCLLNRFGHAILLERINAFHAFVPQRIGSESPQMQHTCSYAIDQRSHRFGFVGKCGNRHTQSTQGRSQNFARQGRTAGDLAGMERTFGIQPFPQQPRCQQQKTGPDQPQRQFGRSRCNGSERQNQGRDKHHI